MGHLTTALYLELSPWLINLQEVGHGQDTEFQLQFRSHIQLVEGSGGGPAASRDAAQRLPARRALEREALPTRAWLKQRHSPVL